MGGFKRVEDRPTPPSVYNWRIYTSAVVIAFGAVTFGYDASFIGVTITTPAFTRDFGLDKLNTGARNNLSSNITSLFQAGAFWGALFVWPVMERFGRRIAMQVSTLVFIIGAIVQLVATHQLSYMYSGRVLVGLGVGGITAAVPTFIAELSPPAIRGQLTGFFEIAYQCGAIVGFWINYGLKRHIDTHSAKIYHIPIAVQLIPAGILFAGTLFLRETPHFLIKRDNMAKALDNLCFLRQLSPDDKYIKEEISAILQQIEHERAVAKGNDKSMVGYLRGAWTEVWLPGIRNRFALTFIMFMFQNFSGVNSINYYSPTIFASLGVSDPSLYTGIYGLLKAIGSFIFYMWFVDSWGRRQPVFTSNLLCAATMLYTAIYVKIGHPATETGHLSPSTKAGGNAAVAAIMIFALCWSFGLNGLPWVVSSEIYPVRLRGLASSYSAASQWLWQFVITKATPSMFTSLGWGTFLLFAGFMVAATIWAYFFLPETKGRRLEDMDELFGFVRPKQKDVEHNTDAGSDRDESIDKRFDSDHHKD